MLRWFHGSISGKVARHAHVPNLLIGPEGRDFVAAATGEINLRRVLVPVTAHPHRGSMVTCPKNMLDSQCLTRASQVLAANLEIAPGGQSNTPTALSSGTTEPPLALQCVGIGQAVASEGDQTRTPPGMFRKISCWTVRDLDECGINHH